MKDEYAYKRSLVFSICYVGFATIALFRCTQNHFYTEIGLL